MLARGLAAALALLALAGCESVQITVTPRIDRDRLPAPLPGAVAILIPEETRALIVSGRPDSLTGATRLHRFALGEALESASRQVFPRVFREVTIVRTPEAAKGHALVLEPRIVDFGFRYDALRYGGFATAAIARVRARLTATREGTVVWVRTVEPPEQRLGPFGEKRREAGMGEAASAAIAAAFVQLANEAVSNPAVVQAVTEGRAEAPK